MENMSSKHWEQKGLALPGTMYLEGWAPRTCFSGEARITSNLYLSIHGHVRKGSTTTRENHGVIN